MTALSAAPPLTPAIGQQEPPQNGHQPADDASLLDMVSFDPNGPFYRSAVRFTRLYATFSPTMTALLMAKKTRLGRYIPLPDALPDGFRWKEMAGLGGNGAGDASAPLATNGAATSEMALIPAVAAPSRNGAQPARAQPQKVDARPVEYQVAHHVPGRLRLTIPQLAYDAKFAQRLADEVMALPDVSRARVSRASRSLLVEYRHQLLSAGRRDALLAQVVEGVRVAARAGAVRAITSEGAAPAQPPPVDVAARMALPALSLGLSAGMLAGLAAPPLLMGGLVLLAARPIFGRAIEGIRTEKRLTVETLDATTITLMVMQGAFLAPSIIVGIIEGAQAARERTARRPSHLTLAQILPPEPRVQVVGAAGPARCHWDEIEPGVELWLHTGDPILVDGLVIEGAGLVDQRRLNGQRQPAAVQAGDAVRAGAVLVEGHLRVLAQQTGHATAAGQAVALIQAGPVRDTSFSNYSRKVGNWAVVPTLLLGAAVYATSGSLVRATGIVNLDLGTGMRVSAPMGIYVARRRAARLGIEFRSGGAVEMLAWSGALAFGSAAAVAQRRDILEALRTLALEVRLLDDADPAAVAAAAAYLEIAPQHAGAGLSPEQKLAAVLAIQESGRRVAFVGHSVDDVAAMRQADVSIALASAGDLAREAADIVLLNDDLADLPVAVELARHAVRLLRQDMALVTAVNAGAIAYGAAAVLGPSAPMLINNGSWALATLNSLRPSHAKPGQTPSRSSQ